MVLSGSMEPGFYRGDILFLHMGHQPIRVGEVVVFNIDERDIPIVHRVIKVHERQPGGEVDLLTKVCSRTQLFASHGCVLPHGVSVDCLTVYSVQCVQLILAEGNVFALLLLTIGSDNCLWCIARVTTTMETTEPCMPEVSCGSIRNTSWAG